MKKKDLKVGAYYSNGKGRVRRVIASGDYKLYPCQADHDCLEYEIVTDGTKKNNTKGKKGRMTRASFAIWAKEEVRARE